MRLLTLLACGCSLANATALYTVTDLGAFNATAISSGGQAAGSGLIPGGATVAFRSGGAAVPVSSQESRAYGINGAGAVAGVQYDAQGRAIATVWDDAGNAAALAGPDSYAMAINDAGTVAGSNLGRAFLAAGGVVQDAGIAAPWSSANAVNASGSAAGTLRQTNGAFRAFLWNAGPGGGTLTLGTLGGASSYGQAINNAGWVAGGSTTVSGYLHAFLAVSGGAAMTDLGTLGGTTSSAYGVNDAGFVVGYSYTLAGEQAAFVYRDGGILDLNSLIAADSGWRLLEARAINNSGQIAGTGLYGGVRRAFRLDPVLAQAPLLTEQPFESEGAAVPEPAAWCLLMAAGILAAARHSIRNLYC